MRTPQTTEVAIEPQRLTYALAGVLGVTLLLPISPTDALSDRDARVLVGQVQTVVTDHHRIVTTEEFNRSGNLTQVMIQSAPEKDAARIVYAYDGQGRVREERAYDADGSLISKTLYSHGYDHQ